MDLSIKGGSDNAKGDKAGVEKTNKAKVGCYRAKYASRRLPAKRRRRVHEPNAAFIFSVQTGSLEG